MLRWRLVRVHCGGLDINWDRVRRHPRHAAILLVCASGCGYQWQEFTSQAGKFKIQMPGKVEEKKKSGPTLKICPPNKPLC